MSNLSLLEIIAIQFDFFNFNLWKFTSIYFQIDKF